MMGSNVNSCIHEAGANLSARCSVVVGNEECFRIVQTMIVEKTAMVCAESDTKSASGKRAYYSQWVRR